MFDVWGPDRHRHAPRLPRLVAESLRLAWRAGRNDVTVIFSIQAASVFGVVSTVLVARSLLSGLLEADRFGGDVAELIPRVFLLATLTGALGIAHAVQLHRQRILAELCLRHGEDRVLAVTGNVELAAFDDPGFHDAVERALVAVRRLPTVVSGLAGLLRGLAGALGAIVALAVLAPLFAPVVMLVVVPLWLAGSRRSRVFHRFAHSITPQDRERRYLAELLSDRPAAKEVRAFGLVRFLRDRHGSLWDRRLRELRQVAGRQLRIDVLANLVVGAIVGAALLALLAMTLADEVTLATAGAAAAVIALLGQRMRAAANSTASLSESALFIDDYLQLVEAPPPQPAELSPSLEPTGPLDVKAQNVTFSYVEARAPAVSDVSLEIAPGEVVALVGENGSGKTTLAKLLAGLYVPDAGRVTIGGLDTATADRDELRHGIALIFQDFMRYALPARENVAVGRPERLSHEEAVHRAARSAGAHDALAALPDGYDTMLGPAFAGGTDLSLGQWQRVALARAIFRDAPFVILDEPTAALDARAESELFAGIREVLAGRSVLLVSHRFSTVRTADRIYVMHGGEIVESGTHDDLIAHDGRYADLFGLQAAPYR